MASKLKGTSLIYRGFQKTHPYRNSFFIKVIEDRDNFKGKVSNQKNIQKILNGIGLKNNPIFASFSKDKAKFFGNPYVMIPKFPFKVYQNPNINDLISDFNSNTSTEDIIKDYQNTLSNKISLEAIFDMKEYYLININHLNSNLPPKLQTNVSNYKQLEDLLGKVIWLFNKKKLQEIIREELKILNNE